jgi:hypothetical protein
MHVTTRELNTQVCIWYQQQQHNHSDSNFGTNTTQGFADPWRGMKNSAKASNSTYKPIVTDQEKVTFLFLLFIFVSKMFEYSLLDLGIYVWFLKILRVDLNRGEKSCYKHAKIFEFGEFLELRHGGATAGHRAGKCNLAGEERLGTVC